MSKGTQGVIFVTDGLTEDGGIQYSRKLDAALQQMVADRGQIFNFLVNSFDTLKNTEKYFFLICTLTLEISESPCRGLKIVL